MTGGAKFLGLLGFVSIVGFTGCANLMPPHVARDAKAGFYETAGIEYRIDAGRNGVPISLAKIEGRLVSYEAVAPQTISEQSVGTLSIEYPHPRGREGYALARVVIESRSGAGAIGANLLSSGREWTEKISSAAAPWNWFGESAGDQASTQPGETPAADVAHVHETWELDIPKSELDTVMGQLDRAGFFDGNATSGSAVELTTRLDRSMIRKRFDPLPELDRLMQVVRGQGRLVSYDRAPQDAQANVAQAGAAVPIAPSVAAYKQAMLEDPTLAAARIDTAPEPTSRWARLGQLFSFGGADEPKVTRLPTVGTPRKF